MHRLLSSCAYVLCKFDRHFTLRCQDVPQKDWLLPTWRHKNVFIWLAKVQINQGVCFAENLEKFGFHFRTKFPQLEHHNCWSCVFKDIFRHILPGARDDLCNGLEETVPCLTTVHMKPIRTCRESPVDIHFAAQFVTFDVKSGSKWRQLKYDQLPAFFVEGEFSHFECQSVLGVCRNLS